MLGVLRRSRPSWRQARPFLIAALLLLFIYTFFFWRLDSMTPGLGPGEYSSRQNSHNTEQIIRRGLDAPYHLVQQGLVDLLNNDVLALRLASVIGAMIIFPFLYLLLRSWFGKAVALFASLIFISTPWVVITARTGTPNIMLLWPIVPLACFSLMSRSKKRAGIWWLLLCLTIGLGLYTPGLVWFLLAGTLATSRSFLNISNRINATYIVAGIALVILLVAPLVLALALEPSRFKQLVLIPDNWQSGVEVLKAIGWSAASLFWSTQSNVDIGIGRLPVLNILQIVLFVFGFYALSSRARHIIFSLVGLLLFAIIISGINDDPHLLLLGLPAVAVLVAAGLRYLYIEWRRIFPINPFAYALAISLISAVVGTHLLYAARYSLIAWPHTTETKSTYVLQ